MRIAPLVLTTAVLAGMAGMAGSAFAAPPDPSRSNEPRVLLERPASVAPFAQQVPLATTPGAVIHFGRFTHYQVNLDPSGRNTVGDAANEPSIAVDPRHHERMVIGWRQFDTVRSDFRQAGVAWSTDGGTHWTTGRLEPGVFRSDPVLACDADGRFYYNSLTIDDVGYHSATFRSEDGGASWDSARFSYGGDKQWIAVDRTDGPGRDGIYQAWSPVGNSYGASTFNRSMDRGEHFEYPSSDLAAGSGIEGIMWGNVEVARDGAVYVIGGQHAGWNVWGALISRSEDANRSVGPPSFTTHGVWTLDLRAWYPPNPEGLSGQLWLGVDRSGTQRDGWLYALASVWAYIGAKPSMEVYFARSTDQGSTWSYPIRVTDDDPSRGEYHWFATMSVAPNGRIDAVWNDSRLTRDSTRTALFYSYSNDAGVHWSANEQVSPVWNCSIGYPIQEKIGDYYTMVSDDDGADVAWAATFNGEEDVYYTRIATAPTSVRPEMTEVAYRLECSPNPFRQSATVRWEGPTPPPGVSVTIYDVTGRRLATLGPPGEGMGMRTMQWNGRDDDGRDVGPGLYLCRAQSGSWATTSRLVKLR